MSALVFGRIFRLNSILRQGISRHLMQNHQRENVEGKEKMGSAAAAPEEANLARKRERLLGIIRRESLLQDQNFRLVSGRSSNFFFDMKKTILDPEGASLLADLLFDKIRVEDVEYIGGLETGAIPIIAAICVRSWPEKPIKGFFVRKEAKGHGTDQRVDGHIERGSKVILFEDVTTTGGSAMQVVNQVQQFGCTILKVMSVVDRLEGARENFQAAGIQFDALFTRRDFS